MADYKSMYYYSAGRMATAVDTLDATTEILKSTTKSLSEALSSTTSALESTSEALTALKEKLKLAQQTTEDMFIDSADEDDLAEGHK